MARFFDAKKHGDLQKQATTESDSFSQLKTQIYANVAPRFEKAAALHQSNQVLAPHNSNFTVQVGLDIDLVSVGDRNVLIIVLQMDAGRWAING
jgi:hypothetical protein